MILLTFCGEFVGIYDNRKLAEKARSDLLDAYMLYTKNHLDLKTPMGIRAALANMFQAKDVYVNVRNDDDQFLYKFREIARNL
jgi:hypothetical protein